MGGVKSSGNTNTVIGPAHCRPATASDGCLTDLQGIMDEQVDRLVKKAWAKYQETPRSKRLLIAVSGIPGSGGTGSDR